MVLVDDMTGNSFLDFIVATDHHNIFCLSTEIPYHPLNTMYDTRCATRSERERERERENVN
jgi:hypothetical protein